MKPILVCYATRHGQTRRVAEHVADDFRGHGYAVELVDARTPPPDLDIGRFAAVVLAGSVQYGKHERELTAFAQRYRAALAALPTAFLSVSGGEATVERTETSAAVREKTSRDVKANIDRFLHDTGLAPVRVLPVAGAMMYSKYNFLVRFMIRQIVKRGDPNIDVSSDHEYTNWAALDRFVEDLAGVLSPSTTTSTLNAREAR